MSCNQKKGSKSLKRAGMKLLKPPTVPKELIVSKENKFSNNVPKEWKIYLGVKNA